MEMGNTLQWRERLWVVAAVVAISSSAVNALAQDITPLSGIGGRESRKSGDEERARLLGALLYTNISVDFAQTPVREAMKLLRQQVPVQIIGRYSDDSTGAGIDPETPISLKVADQPALDVLEEILRQCDGLEECTWQLRRGFVEIGTKERLSVPAAQETRLYDIQDMLLEPPTFSSDDDAMVRQFRQQFGGHDGKPARPDDQGTIRKAPLAIAVGIVEEVVETIEPGHWDYGQREPTTPPDQKVEPKPEGAPTTPSKPSPDSPQQTTPAPAQPAAAPSPPAAQPVVSNVQPKYWARIRVWRGQLIVVAPDFIHRQVGGYPKAIRPGAPVDEAARPAPVR